jgi:predicted Zn-dependent protease
LKTERRLNLRFLFWFMVVLAVTGAGAFLLHQHQMGRHARALLDEAAQATANGQRDRAALLLHRYRMLEPADAEAVARHGLLLEQLATSPSERDHALSTLQLALVRLPSNRDIRKHVAALQIARGDFAEARQNLQHLLESAPLSEQGALQSQLGQCLEGEGDDARAVLAYERAIALGPGQIEDYVRLAQVWRQGLQEPRKAVEVMDALIAANKGSWRAYLARARFRSAAGALEAAEQDLSRAAELAPTEVEILLARADLAQLLERIADARSLLQKGAQQHPMEARFYRALAALELQAGQTAAVLRCLRQGLEAVPGQSDMQAALADILIDQGQVEEAKGIIAELRQRMTPAPLADYLDGRLALRNGDWLAAIEDLTAVTESPEAPVDVASRAWLALARCYEHNSAPDKQNEAYAQAVSLEPGSVPARLGLGTSLLALGKSDGAIEQFRELTRLRGAPAAAWTLLGQALVQRNQRLPERARNWQEVDAALDRAAQSPDQVAAVAVVRADALVARDQSDAAKALLEEVSAAHPQDVALWQARVRLAARQGSEGAAVRLLVSATPQGGDRGTVLLTQLDYWAERGGREADSVLAQVEKSCERLPAVDQVRVLQRLAETYWRLGNRSAAERLCLQLTERSLDLQGWVSLLDLGLEMGHAVVLERTMPVLHRLEGDSGTWWRYAEATQLMAGASRGNKSVLSKAHALVAEIGEQRPDWPRVPLLEAQLAELEGDSSRALGHYLKALGLGEHQLRLVARVMQLLTAGERFVEADQLLQNLQPRLTLPRDFARHAAEIALRAGNREHALELARKAVSETSKDYRDHAWRAGVLAAAGHSTEAEEALRLSIRCADTIPDPWLALVSFQWRQGQAEQAAATLAEMQRHLSAEQLPLALAQAHEVLTRLKDAEEQYQVALTRQPQDFIAVQKAATFYLRIGRPAKAEPLIERLLKPELAAPEELTAWAQRQRAMLLAASEEEAKIQEALVLLDRNRALVGDTVADRRARAFIQTGRGSSEAQRQAVREIEESVKLQPLAADEQFRLAQLCERVDNWAKARELFVSLLTQDGHNPAYLAFYIRSLLHRGKKEEAQPWLARLEKVEPDAPQTRELREQFRAASK